MLTELLRMGDATSSSKPAGPFRKLTRHAHQDAPFRSMYGQAGSNEPEYYHSRGQSHFERTIIRFFRRGNWGGQPKKLVDILQEELEGRI